MSEDNTININLNVTGDNGDSPKKNNRFTNPKQRAEAPKRVVTPDPSVSNANAEYVFIPDQDQPIDVEAIYPKSLGLETLDPSDIVQDQAIPEIGKVSNLKNNLGANAQDKRFLARFDNLMDRTDKSVTFKQLHEKHIRGLRDVDVKAEKIDSIEELNKFIDDITTSQLASLKQYETTLLNSFNLISTDAEIRLEQLEAVEPENQDENHAERVELYTSALKDLSARSETILAYVNQASESIKTMAVTKANEGFERGKNIRMVEEQLKTNEQNEKIVADFEKEFLKVSDQYYKDYSKQEAFNQASEYANKRIQEDPDLKRSQVLSEARAYYQKVYQDTYNLRPTSSGLTPTEIVDLYNTQNGEFTKANYSSILPPMTANGSGGSFIPPSPPGNGAGGGGDSEGQGGSFPIPPNQQNLGLTIPQEKTDNTLVNGILIHQAVTEITHIFAMIADMIKVPIEEAFRILEKSTRKEHISIPDYVGSLGKMTDQFAHSSFGAIGSVAGGLAGTALFPGLGTIAGPIAGSFLGRNIGNVAADALGISTVTEITKLLFQIEKNTADQVQGFSSDIIEARLSNQLHFLEKNVQIGERYGTMLAGLENGSNVIQQRLYDVAVEVLVQFEPILKQIIGVLLLAIPLIKGIALSVKLLVDAIFEVIPQGRIIRKTLETVANEAIKANKRNQVFNDPTKDLMDQQQQR